MDMPDVDLRRLLSPPAIVGHLDGNLENRIILAHAQHDAKCDASYKAKREALSELLRPLEINFFMDEKSGLYFEFIKELNKKEPLIATRVYYPNSYDEPTQLVKIVYFGKDGTLVIWYRDGGENFSENGFIEWYKPKNIRCIQKDDGSHGHQVRKAYSSHLELQKIEEIRRQREYDEKNGVIMIAKQ